MSCLDILSEVDLIEFHAIIYQTHSITSGYDGDYDVVAADET